MGEEPHFQNYNLQYLRFWHRVMFDMQHCGGAVVAVNTATSDFDLTMSDSVTYNYILRFIAFRVPPELAQPKLLIQSRTFLL